MDFADDIALIGKSNELLQLCSDDVKTNAERVGLRFNAKKCEAMGTLGKEANIKIDNHEVKNVTEFTYLGSKISSDGQSTTEIKCRLGKAASSFGKMSSIWTSKKISLKTKLNLYHSTIVSILLYGSETWKIYAAEKKKLNAFHTRCLRKILGIKWQDKIRNEEVMRRTNEREMMKIITERRLRWFGHVVRMKESRVPKKVLEWKPEGKRNRGRQKLTWREQISKDFNSMDVSWSEACNIAEDRTQWKLLTAQCASNAGRTKV